MAEIKEYLIKFSKISGNVSSHRKTIKKIICDTLNIKEEDFDISEISCNQIKIKTNPQIKNEIVIKKRKINQKIQEMIGGDFLCLIK